MRLLSLFIVFLLVSLPFSSAVSSSYFYVGSSSVALKSDSDVKYLYHDRLGGDTSTKSLPFGQELLEGDRFGFTGKELDDSGLHYFGARYVDTNLGRFTSIDPVEGMFPYQYVHNDPLNMVDPSGMAGKPKEVFRGDLLVSLDDVGAITASNPSAKITVTQHIIHSGGEGGSQFISVTGQKSVARHFAGKDGYVVKVDTKSGITGRYANLKEITQMIKQEVSSGKVTSKQGSEALKKANKNLEGLIMPTKKDAASILVKEVESVGSGRRFINLRGGGTIKGLGIAGTVVGIGMSIGSVAHATEEGGASEGFKQGAVEVGGWGGALVGGAVGGKFGAVCGTAVCPGLGTAIGGFVGGLAGGCIGGVCGEGVIEGVVHPPERRNVGPDLSDPRVEWWGGQPVFTDTAQSTSVKLP